MDYILLWCDYELKLSRKDELLKSKFNLRIVNLDCESNQEHIIIILYFDPIFSYGEYIIILYNTWNITFNNPTNWCFYNIDINPIIIILLLNTRCMHILTYICILYSGNQITCRF